MEATRPDFPSALSPSQVLNSPPRPARTPVHSPLLSPGSPSPPSSRRILVVVTVDAERYTPVDLTDVLDEGAVIRHRILNKLSIWDEDDQERSLIYETQIGALPIGEPLTDQVLSEMCHERGDSRASLVFIVQRPPPRITNPQTSQHPGNSDAARDLTSPSTAQRQRNRSHTSNDQQSLAPPTANGHRPEVLSTPPRRTRSPHRTTRPTDISVEGHGNANLDERQPRRVRPLPAIPTPTSSPNSGNSMGHDPYPHIQAVTNEFDDLYNYAPVQATLQVVEPHRADGAQISEASPTNPSNRPVSPKPMLPDGRTSPRRPVGSHTPSPATNVPSNKPALPRLALPNSEPSARGPIASRTPSPAPTPLKWVRGRLIGKGKYGRVYMALDPTKGEIMAVKQIEIPEDRPGSRSLVEALKFESELLRTLSHENIVKYIHFEEIATLANIFMEYVPGGTLSSTLKKFRPFSQNITKSFIAQILNCISSHP